MVWATYFKTFNQTDSGGYGDANFVAMFNMPGYELAGDFNPTASW